MTLASANYSPCSYYSSFLVNGYKYPLYKSGTYLHSYTATQLHSYTATQLHSYTATQLILLSLTMKREILKDFESKRIIPAIHSVNVPKKRISHGRQPQVYKNPKKLRRFLEMAFADEADKSIFDDIILGICRSVPKDNQKQKRLTISPRKLKYLFSIKKVSNRHIQGHLNLSERQSKKYLTAYKAARVHIDRWYKTAWN